MSVVKERFRSAKHLMESELIKRGYLCGKRKKFDEECDKDGSETKRKNPPRFTYCKGSFRVLTESQDRPFWTVQKTSGGNVVWFVDFPLDVEVDAVFAFVESA